MESVAASALTFALESAPDVFDEIRPLIQLHFLEVGHYQDIPLDPNFDAYAQAQAAGKIRVYTAREPEAGALVGYAVYFVAEHIHHAGSLQAVADVIFMHPGFRGTGLGLIRHAERALRDEGVQVVYQHIKASHNFGKALERMGYELVDLIYGKRLDKGGI